ncbi:hypothetical protein BDV19DRAFT_356151 [Aspergillus venezuelensis]
MFRMNLSAFTLPLTLLASSVLAVDVDIRNLADGLDWTQTTVPLSSGSNCTQLPIAQAPLTEKKMPEIPIVIKWL